MKKYSVWFNNSICVYTADSRRECNAYIRNAVSCNGDSAYADSFTIVKEL